MSSADKEEGDQVVQDCAAEVQPAAQLAAQLAVPLAVPLAVQLAVQPERKAGSDSTGRSRPVTAGSGIRPLDVLEINRCICCLTFEPRVFHPGPENPSSPWITSQSPVTNSI